MNFIYGDDIPFIDLRPGLVNGKDGWSLVLGTDEDDEVEDELLFESTEDLEAFAARLAVLLKREQILS